MNYPNKKKRFVYNPIVTDNKTNKPETITHDFPDDFNAFVSQPSKKLRLSNEAKQQPDENLLDGIDLNDDDFDFSQAVNEIDQIEIAASQVSKKSTNDSTRPFKVDQNLDSGKKKNGPSTLSLKIPKKNEIVQSKNDVNIFLSPLQSRPLNQKSVPLVSTTNIDLSFRESTTDNPTFTNDLVNIEKHQVKILQEELFQYKTKLKDTEQKFHSKDGEIKILRESLRKFSEHENQHKSTILKLESDLRTQQTEKENNLLREVEQLKTQLKFKEQEVKDALERQKKASVTVVKKSPKFSTPYKNSFGSGFQPSPQHLKPQSTSQGPQKIEEYKSHFMRSFKLIHENNSRLFSLENEIFKKVSLESYSLKKDKFECKCFHLDLNPNINFSKRHSELCNQLQTALELININSFHILDFVCKVCKMLNNMNSMTTTKNSSTPVSRNSDSENNMCPYCQETYDHTVKSLIILSEACTLYPSLRKYFLMCVAHMQGKKSNLRTDKTNTAEVKEYGGCQYYKKFKTDDDSYILVESMELVSLEQCKQYNFKETDLVYGIQFWTSLDLLQQSSHSTLIQEKTILLYTALLTSTATGLCDCLIAVLQTEQVISKYLSTPSLDRIILILHLLQNSVSLKNVNKLICSHTDQCPLLLIYNALIAVDCETTPMLLLVFKELICFISSFIACNQRKAFKLLLDSDCQCSNEIIECWITLLFDEFKYLQSRIFTNLKDLQIQEKDRLSTFRQGMSLLCMLCSNDKTLVEKRSAVECSYIFLLVGTIKMYRKIPLVNDSEVLALEDLLDMDQYIELDEDDVESFPVESDQQGTSKSS